MPTCFFHFIYYNSNDKKTLNFKKIRRKSNYQQMGALTFISVLPVQQRYCTFAPPLQKCELRESSKATRITRLPYPSNIVASSINERRDHSADDENDPLATPNFHIIRSNSASYGDEASEEDKEFESARKLAQMYAEMEEHLGPPVEKYKRGSNVKNKSKSTDRKTVASNEPSLHSSSDILPSESQTSSENDSTSTKTEPEPMKKKAETFEEEYKLFETLLRGGAKSSKPRRGRRRYIPRGYLADEIVVDPWRTSYNLMPKKSARKKKGEPPKKGPPNMNNPKEIKITLEGIDQSYFALEKVLDVEEIEWEREQNRIKKIQDQKRDAHEKRRAIKKANRRANAALEAKPSDPSRNESTSSSSYQGITNGEQDLNRYEGDIPDFVPVKTKNSTASKEIPPYWTLNPPIQSKVEKPGLFNARVFASPLPFLADVDDPSDEEADEMVEPRKSKKKSRVHGPKVLRLTNPKIWK